MMLYPSLSSLLENVNSRYMLVNVVANRARQLSANAEENEEPLTKKAVSLAIDEIAAGEIRVNCDNTEF